MRRFFFNVFNDKASFHDEHGIELANPVDVRLHMISLASAVIEDKAQLAERWEIEALNERGFIAASMTFGAEHPQIGQAEPFRRLHR